MEQNFAFGGRQPTNQGETINQSPSIPEEALEADMVKPKWRDIKGDLPYEEHSTVVTNRRTLSCNAASAFKLW